MYFNHILSKNITLSVKNSQSHWYHKKWCYYMQNKAHLHSVYKKIVIQSNKSVHQPYCHSQTQSGMNCLQYIWSYMISRCQQLAQMLHKGGFTVTTIVKQLIWLLHTYMSSKGYLLRKWSSVDSIMWTRLLLWWLLGAYDLVYHRYYFRIYRKMVQ